jgi:hypothetical protein
LNLRFCSKNKALNPNAPVTDRVEAGVKMAGEAISGGAHRAAEKYYAAPPITEAVSETVDNVKTKTSEMADNISGTPFTNAKNRLEENTKIKEFDREYEEQKNQAIDPNLPVLDRMVAGTRMTEAAIAGGLHRAAEQYYAAPPLSETVQGLTEVVKEKTSEIVENIKIKTGEISQNLRTSGEEATLSDQVTAKSNEVLESMKAREADAAFELHKSQATDPNLPVLDRLAAGTHMLEDAVTGSFHRAAGSYYKM